MCNILSLAYSMLSWLQGYLLYILQCNISQHAPQRFFEACLCWKARFCFCSLPAEVAALLHPQTHWRKSGLCHRESAALSDTLPWTQSKFPHLKRLHLYLPGSAHHLWCRRCQVSKRHRRPHLRLQHLHGGPVRLCAHVSHGGFQDRSVSTHYF